MLKLAECLASVNKLYVVANLLECSREVLMFFAYKLFQPSFALPYSTFCDLKRLQELDLGYERYRVIIMPYSEQLRLDRGRENVGEIFVDKVTINRQKTTNGKEGSEETQKTLEIIPDEKNHPRMCKTELAEKFIDNVCSDLDLYNLQRWLCQIQKKNNANFNLGIIGENGFKISQDQESKQKLNSRAKIGENAEKNFMRGKIFYDKGEYSEAERYFFNAIRLGKKDAETYCLKGLCNFENKNFPWANEDFSCAIELDPKCKKAYFYRARCYLRSLPTVSEFKHFGLLQGAKQDCQQAKKLGLITDELKKLYEAIITIKDTRSTKKKLIWRKKQLKNSPGQPKSSLLSTEQNEDFIDEVNKGKQKQKQNATIKDETLTKSTKTKSKKTREKTREKKESIVTSESNPWKLNPQEKSARRQIEKQRRKEEREKNKNKATELFEIGMNEYRQKNYDSALKHFDQAIIFYKDCKFYLQKGRCLYKTEKYQDALQAFTDAFSIDSKNTLVIYFRARCYWKRDERNKSIQDFSRAINLILKKHTQKIKISDQDKKILRQASLSRYEVYTKMAEEKQREIDWESVKNEFMEILRSALIDEKEKFIAPLERIFSILADRKKKILNKIQANVQNDRQKKEQTLQQTGKKLSSLIEKSLKLAKEAKEVIDCIAPGEARENNDKDEKVNKSILVFDSLIAQLNKTNSEIYIYLGIIATGQRKLTQALDFFTKAIECNKDSYCAYIRRGKTYKKIKDFDNAKKDFSLAIKLIRDEMATIYGDSFVLSKHYAILGEVHLGLEEYSIARSWYIKAQQSRNGDLSLYYKIAKTYYKEGKHSLALEWLEKAEKLTGGDDIDKAKITNLQKKAKMFLKWKQSVKKETSGSANTKTNFPTSTRGIFFCSLIGKQKVHIADYKGLGGEQLEKLKNFLEQNPTFTAQNIQ